MNRKSPHRQNGQQEPSESLQRAAQLHTIEIYVFVKVVIYCLALPTRSPLGLLDGLHPFVFLPLPHCLSSCMADLLFAWLLKGVSDWWNDSSGVAVIAGFIARVAKFNCLLQKLFTLSQLHPEEDEHRSSLRPLRMWGLAQAPPPVPSQLRTMERCLSLFHLQGFSLTCFTWVYAFTDQPFAGAWAHGGPPTIIYGGVLAICGSALVTLSLAEVASACPSIGGKYQDRVWQSSMHANPSKRRFLSFYHHHNMTKASRLRKVVTSALEMKMCCNEIPQQYFEKYLDHHCLQPNDFHQGSLWQFCRICIICKCNQHPFMIYFFCLNDTSHMFKEATCLSVRFCVCNVIHDRAASEWACKQSEHVNKLKREIRRGFHVVWSSGGVNPEEGGGIMCVFVFVLFVACGTRAWS